MKNLLFTLLILCSVSLAYTQEVAWVQTFTQANAANPNFNSEQLSVRADGTFWLATMPQRNSFWSVSALGDFRLYQMDLNGMVLDSILAFGNGAVLEMSSYDNETFLLVTFYSSFSIASQTFPGSPGNRQMILHINGQGQPHVLWEQPDTTATICATGPDEFITVSKQGLTDAHITRFDTLGNILQSRPIPEMGRAYAISQGPDSDLIISGSCLGNSFQLDSISLSSSGFYNEYLLKLDSNFRGIWGNLIDDNTCQQIRHRQSDQGNILLGASTTQPLTFGTVSHQGPNSSNTDFFLTELDANGTYQWVQEIPGDTGWSRASIASELGMDFDPLGNAYMIGTANSVIDWGGGQFTASAFGETDAFVISWDGTGALRWVRNLGLGGNAIPSRIEVLGVDSMLISGVCGVATDSALFGSHIIPVDLGDEFITLIVPEIVTSTSLATSPHIGFYPNPFDDVVFIAGDVTGLSYELCDLHGKVLMVGNLEKAIHASSLVPGLYFIVVRNENGERVQFHKLVKR